MIAGIIQAWREDRLSFGKVDMMGFDRLVITYSTDMKKWREISIKPTKRYVHLSEIAPFAKRAFAHLIKDQAATEAVG